MEKLKESFGKLFKPVLHLLGHSLAVVVGFTGLAIISLIPIGVVHALVAFGITQLAEPLHVLESIILIVDVAVFLVVFLSGVFAFVVEVIVSAKDEIRKIWKD